MAFPHAASPDVNEQLVLVDVSNTSIVVGISDSVDIHHHFRLSTEPRRTTDELAALLTPLFERADLDPAASTGFVAASVVPPLNPVIRQLAEQLCECEALLVGPGVKSGLPIRYDNPSEVGADRIANAVAALELYGAPVAVVDFDTATTFDVVNAAGEYAGGVIAPGIAISAEALFSQASRLFRVDLQKPERLIGRSTAGAVQSGIYYGYLGLVDGILERLLEEVEGLSTVVSTGNRADLLTAASVFIDQTHPMLTLIGLQLIHGRNRRRR